MASLLNAAYNPETFRKNGHLLVDLLADYLDKAFTDPNLKALPWMPPEEMAAKCKEDFNTPWEGDMPLISFFEKIIANSIHLHHPRYMGHQVVPPAPMAALVELAATLLNNSMAVYEVGPFSSAVEKQVTDWLGSSLGLGENAAGILTSGGTIGNLTGLLAARQHQAPYNIWEEGNKNSVQLAVLVSSESHYSIARAVKIMGMGDEGVVKIPVNNRMEIDPNALERVYRNAINEGKHVIAVAANACSTSTGSYDPLEPIAGFCKSNNLWFHVDAAHGGGAVFTRKYKHLVKGIENADSVVIDFHKMLLCPALTSAVIFKNGDTAYETFSQKASYLLSQEKKGNWFDIAQRTLECTKKMMGLKIYALLKLYGVQLFDEYITHAYDLAAEFAELIHETPNFELAIEPASNIVCFRFIPQGIESEKLNTINLTCCDKIKEEGEFYIVRTTINEMVYLRTTLMNPFTTNKDLVQLLDKIHSIGQSLI